MKKTYMAPESLSVSMNVENMIAASIGVNSKEVDAQSALSNKKDMWGHSDMWN